MKKVLQNAMAFLVALFMFAAFWTILLASGLASRSLVMIIGAAIFAVWIFFSVKKKSVLSAVLSFFISFGSIYLIRGLNLLIGFLINLFKEINLPWIGYVLIGIFAIGLIILFLKIWRFLSGIYIIVKPDEAHVVTRINGEQYVYSGNKKIDGYAGNHYLDFSKIPWLKFFLGMTVQKTRLDDQKIEIPNIEDLKSEDRAELGMGLAAFHCRNEKPKIVSKRWPGEDMDLKLFQEEILDLVKESVELTVAEFPIIKLVGGSMVVNQRFKEILQEKLGDEYGILITNANLSKENGDAVEAIKKVRSEELRGEEEEATLNADKKIQIATDLKQVAANKVIATTAEGLKKKKIIDAEAAKEVKIKEAEATAKDVELAAIADALKIIKEGGAKADALKKLVEAQASNEVFLKAKALDTQQGIAEALKDLYPNLSYIIGQGGAGLAEVAALIKTGFGIDLNKIITGKASEEAA